jgi:membrane protease subunit HflK
MPWTNNSGGGGPWGGGGRPGGPWGGGGGPGLPQPPNVDELLRKGQDFVRRFLPPGFGGGKGLAIVGAIVVGVWLLSGFYRVQPDEQGVVLRFGAFDRTTPPGLNYALPFPIETVMTPRVTRINRIDVGFRSQVEGPRAIPVRAVPEESLMLTGDENIIDINFAVFWRIRDAGEFLFNIRNPEQTVKAAAESVMREVIGRTPIQPALTEARAQIEQAVREGTQAMLDQYRAGIELAQVQLQKVDPPAAVIDAFRDVQRANADRERLRNEAESFRNDIIPRARGEAERFVQEAQGDREGRIARARGEGERFTQILAAYSQARDVTRTRLYLETLEEILRASPTVLVDDKVQNLVPFLPLNDLNRAMQRAQQPGASQPQPLPVAPGGLPGPAARAIR